MADAHIVIWYVPLDAKDSPFDVVPVTAQIANRVATLETLYDRFGLPLGVVEAYRRALEAANRLPRGRRGLRWAHLLGRPSARRARSEDGGGLVAGKGGAGACRRPLTAAARSVLVVSLPVGAFVLTSAAVSPGTAGADTPAWSIQAHLPTSEDGVRSISCASVSDCVAVAYGPGPSYAGLIYTTTDAGGTWTSRAVPTGVTSIYGVSCSSVQDCVAVTNPAGAGTTGDILTTSDGGLSWASQSMPSGLRGLSVSCPSGTDACYITTYRDSDNETLVLASFDRGDTWSPEDLGTTTPFFGISCSSATTCLTVGYGYTGAGTGQLVYTTSNAGASWTHHAVPGTDVLWLFGASCVTGSSFCVVSGYDATKRAAVALVSSDGGGTWTASGLLTGVTIYGVSCASVTQCVIVGQASNNVGVIAGSDGGKTWSDQTIPSDTGLMLAISCPSTSICEAGGLDTSYAGIIEGGATASPATVPLDRYLNVSDSSVHWATTDPAQVPSGFTDEGNLGELLQSPGSGLLALYSCKDGGDGNYLSIDQSGQCEAGSQPGLITTDLGVAGYVYASRPSDGTDTLQLYRCFRPSPSDHLETTVPPVTVDGQQRCGEDPTDYAYEGPLGWIIAEPPADLPEAPAVPLLPLAAVAVIAGGAVRRRMRSIDRETVTSS